MPPKSVSVRRGSQLYEEQQLALVNARLESQNKAPDALEGPKYEESISDKRQRLRSAARRAVMEHVRSQLHPLHLSEIVGVDRRMGYGWMDR